MGAASSDDELDFEEDVRSSPPRDDPEAQPAQPQPDAASTAERQGPTAEEVQRYANACCEEMGLADATKEEVLRCAQLPPQLFMIRMYTRLCAIDQEVQQSTVAGFLDSPNFKEHITRRLQAGLLDPNIVSFVEGATARFVRHMTENPAAYHIPSAVHLNYVHTKAFFSAVSTVLSNARAEIRRKILKSIAEKQDIYTLAQKLAIRGFQLTEAHAQMISFIRMYLIKLHQTEWPEDENPPQLWTFVDGKLLKFRKKSQASQAKALKKNIAEDKKLFPVPKSTKPALPAVVFIPQWQTDISAATVAMAKYQIDPTSEEQEQDESGSPEQEAARATLSNNPRLRARSPTDFDNAGNAAQQERQAGNGENGNGDNFTGRRYVDIDGDEEIWPDPDPIPPALPGNPTDEDPANPQENVDQGHIGPIRARRQGTPRAKTPSVNIPPKPHRKRTAKAAPGATESLAGSSANNPPALSQDLDAEMNANAAYNPSQSSTARATVG